MEGIGIVLRDCLGTVSDYALASLIFTGLFAITYLYVKEHGLKNTFLQIKNELMQHKEFRIKCAFIFVCFMIADRTILGRTGWVYPLTNPIGDLGIYTSDGSFNFDLFENIVLFIPLIAVLPVAFPNVLKGREHNLWKSISRLTLIGFIYSLSIETTQLLLRLGKFQFSDMVFNTVGGLIGAVIWRAYYKFISIRRRSK